MGNSTVGNNKALKPLPQNGSSSVIVTSKAKDAEEEQLSNYSAVLITLVFSLPQAVTLCDSKSNFGSGYLFSSHEEKN